MVTARLRRRSGMRQLDVSQAFRAEEVKHDRIKVRAMALIGYSSADRMSEYLSLVADISGYESPVFRVLATRWPHMKNVEVADGWLFSGRGNIRNLARPHGGVANLEMEINVNPTRFLANHPGEASVAELAALQPREALRQSSFGDEARRASLTGTDNVLVGARRQGGTAFEHRQAWWQSVISVYLAHVRTLLTSTLVPHAGNALPQDVQVEVTLPSVAQAECYWEFETDDAITAVKGLAEHLATAAGSVQLRTYLPSSEVFAQEQQNNSVSVTLPLTDTVHATIYAKTADRVRFEIKYLKDVRGAGARHLRGTPGVELVIDGLRENAASRIETIIGALASIMAPAEPTAGTMWSFFDALVWAANNNFGAAQQLHSILMNFGSVSQGVEGAASSPDVLHRLVQRGVLRRIRIRHGGIPRYTLTPPYAAIHLALKRTAP
jgi:hypothetical protein